MRGASYGSTRRLRPSSRTQTASVRGATVTARTMLTDEQWQMLEPMLPSASGHQGRPYAGDHRRTVEGILWIFRTGAPWRDLPDEFGNWNTVYRRFRRWSESGVFSRILAAFATGLDLALAMIDGTFTKAHQHAAGARKGVAHLPSPENCNASGPRQVG